MKKKYITIEQANTEFAAADAIYYEKLNAFLYAQQQLNNARALRHRALRHRAYDIRIRVECGARIESREAV